jgi:lysophospholipase L1-like esterase
VPELSEARVAAWRVTLSRRTALRVAIQIVLTVVLFEVALQIYQPLPFRVRGDRIVLPVRASYTFYNEGPKLDRVVHHTKNSLGFRGPEPPRDFSAPRTIVAVGGSTAECLYLSDGKTWTDRLAERLRATFPDVWVNNAGLDGHSTFGHIVLLKQVVVPLRPDLVLFLVGVNDMGLGNLNRFDARLAPSRGRWTRAVSAVAEHVELVALAQNVVRGRRAQAQGLGHTEMALERWPRVTPDDVDTEARVREYAETLPAYASRLETLVQLSRDAGIVPVFITQPALIGVGTDPATGVDLGSLRVFEGVSGALQWRLLEMTNAVTRRVASDRGVQLIDLARELPKDSRFYYDLWHYSNEGAVRVGDIVGAHLEGFLRRSN